MPKAKKSPLWIFAIRKGDVLRAPSGLLRVVRHVSHHEGRYRSYVWIVFAIRRCSWTGRPTTYYEARELANLGYRPTNAKRRKLTGKRDQLIEREITQEGYRHFLHCSRAVDLP